MVRSGLHTPLDDESDPGVVGEAAAAREAPGMVKALRPGVSGIKTMVEIKRRHPETAIRKGIEGARVRSPFRP